MPRTRAAHRLPSREPTRHSSGSTGPSASASPSWRLVAGVAAGILALCAVGVGVGVHAALGDGDGPAVQLANRGVDLRPEAQGDGAGASSDGTAAGSPDAGAPPASEPPAPPRSVPPNPPATGAPAPGTPPARPSTPPTPHAPPTSMTNPYLDPADPRYVPEADRAAWLQGQQRVRECMAAAGQQYLEWEWWQGGSPKPAGLDESAETAWMLALQGDEGSAGCAVEAGDAPTPPAGMERPENATPPPAEPQPVAPSPEPGAGYEADEQQPSSGTAPEASTG